MKNKTAWIIIRFIFGFIAFIFLMYMIISIGNDSINSPSEILKSIFK